MKSEEEASITRIGRSPIHVIPKVGARARVRALRLRPTQPEEKMLTLTRSHATRRRACMCAHESACVGCVSVLVCAG